MTDVEHRLQEMFERRGGDVGSLEPFEAPREVVLRTRRRQLLTVSVGSLAAIAVAVGVVTGVVTLMHATPTTPIGPRPSPSPRDLPPEAEVPVAAGAAQDLHWWLYTSRDGSCYVMAFDSGDSSSCGGPDPGQVTQASRYDFGAFPEFPPVALVFGTTAPNAGRVLLEMNDGTSIEAGVYARPADVSGDRTFFVAALTDVRPPNWVDGHIVVLDGGGATIDRIELQWPTWAEATTRRTIATGNDPLGGHWEATLSESQSGPMLDVASNAGVGGGSNCCAPLHGEAILMDSSATMTGQPTLLTGFASPEVERASYVHSDGTTFEAHLSDFPSDIAGPRRLVVVFVPEALSVNGDVVAYDADGNELGRSAVVDPLDSGSPGPTVEIDVVWARLRRAREGIYPAGPQHSFSGIDAEAAARLLDPGIHWNDSRTAVPGEVSIRGAGTDTIVIVSTTTTRRTFCIGIGLADGGLVYRYGIQDAQTFSECHGGWNDA